MHRVFRLTAGLVASLMVLFAAAPILAAAQSGVTSATTYESTLFGYEVEWTEDWAVVDAFTQTLDTSDQLRVVNEELGIWVDVWGFDTNRSAASMMPAYETLLVDSGVATDLETSELESSIPGAGVAVYNYLIGDNQTPIEELAEFRMIDGAFIVTSIKAAPDRSLLAAGLAATMIQVEGDAIFPAVFGEGEGTEEDDPITEEGNDPVSGGEGLVGNIYSSPTFGVALSFDEDVWEVNDEHEAEDEEDRDSLTLDLIDTPGRLWLESYGFITRASECIEFAVGEAVPDDLDIQLLEDEDGEPIEGSARGVAWAAYTWVNEDDDSLATYVECRALPGGTGVFVATLLTNLDDFEDAFAATSDVLATVNVEGGEPLGSDDEEAEPTTEAEEEETPETEEGDDPVGASYESPTWGFTLAVDESTWEIVRDRTRNDVDTLQLEADGDLFLDISSYELGRRDDAQSCVEDFIADFDFEIEEGETDDNGEIYSTLGTYLDDDDAEWSIVITCREDPSGAFVVRAVGEAPIDAEDDLLEAMAPLVTSIEFP
jgi:hypothetical protein